jgi:hypothetical protein
MDEAAQRGAATSLPHFSSWRSRWCLGHFARADRSAMRGAPAPRPSRSRSPRPGQDRPRTAGPHDQSPPAPAGPNASAGHRARTDGGLRLGHLALAPRGPDPPRAGTLLNLLPRLRLLPSKAARVRDPDGHCFGGSRLRPDELVSANVKYQVQVLWLRRPTTLPGPADPCDASATGAATAPPLLAARNVTMPNSSGGWTRRPGSGPMPCPHLLDQPDRALLRDRPVQKR